MLSAMVGCNPGVPMGANLHAGLGASACIAAGQACVMCWHECIMLPSGSWHANMLHRVLMGTGDHVGWMTDAPVVCHLPYPNDLVSILFLGGGLAARTGMQLVLMAKRTRVAAYPSGPLPAHVWPCTRITVMPPGSTL